MTTRRWREKGETREETRATERKKETKNVNLAYLAEHQISILLSADLILTHYQTTNFRLFQTERVCRRQFQI